MAGYQDNPLFRRPAVVTILAMICILFWGSAASVIKVAYGAMQMDTNHIPSLLLFAGIRFSITGTMILVIFSFLERKFLYPATFRNGWRILVLMFFETFMQYVPYYIGLGRTSGTTAAIIHGCNGFTTILIAVVLFQSEKMTLRKAFGCLLGVGAVFLMNLSGLRQGVRMTLIGEGMLILAQIGYVIGVNLTKVYGTDSDPIMLTGWQFVVGGILLVLMGMVTGGSLVLDNGLAVLVLTYLSVYGAVAYALWSILLKNNEVSRIAVYNFFIPICGILFSVILLGETTQAFRWETLGALALTSLGIRVSSKKNPSPLF